MLVSVYPIKFLMFIIAPLLARIIYRRVALPRLRITRLRRIALLRRGPGGRISLLGRIALLRRIPGGRISLLRIPLRCIPHWSCQLPIDTCRGSREDVHQHSGLNQQEADEPAPAAKRRHFDQRPDIGDQANYSTGHKQKCSYAYKSGMPNRCNLVSSICVCVSCASREACGNKNGSQDGNSHANQEEGTAQRFAHNEPLDETNNDGNPKTSR